MLSLNDDIDGAVIEDALKTSYAQEFVDGLPEKINELVMERGVLFPQVRGSYFPLPERWRITLPSLFWMKPPPISTRRPRF